MIETKAVKAKIQVYGLVRDKNGKPKIKNYAECHDSIKALLTKEEKEEYENGTNTR